MRKRFTKVPPVVVTRVNVRWLCSYRFFLRNLQLVNHASHICSFQWLAWAWAGEHTSRSWLVAICRGTHMEIMSIDPLEGLLDLLNFFALQNFLPRCPSSTSCWVRVHYQLVSCTISEPKNSEVALSTPRKALYHLSDSPLIRSSRP